MSAPSAPAVHQSMLQQAASFGDQLYPSFELKAVLNYLNEHELASDSGDKAQSPLELIAATGISLDELEEPFIPAHKALSALNTLLEHFYRPCLGADIAATYTLAELGPIGVSLKHCEHLLDALSTSNDYYSLIGSFNDIYNITNDSEFCQRLVNVAQLSPRTLRFLFEMTVSGCRALARELTGETIRYQSIAFEGDLSDEDKQRYQGYFDTDIVDGAQYHEWRIAIEQLQLPLLPYEASPETSATELRALLDLLRSEQGLADNLDCILKGCAGDFPDQDMISHALGMSSRTLRRRLNQIGISYSALLDKVRCQLAMTLLQHQQLSNETIAAELGYSDAANFCNAFKKWTGKAPSAYRPTDA